MNLWIAVLLYSMTNKSLKRGDFQTRENTRTDLEICRSVFELLHIIMILYVCVLTSIVHTGIVMYVDVP